MPENSVEKPQDQYDAVQEGILKIVAESSMPPLPGRVAFCPCECGNEDCTCKVMVDISADDISDGEIRIIAAACPHLQEVIKFAKHEWRCSWDAINLLFSPEAKEAYGLGIDSVATVFTYYIIHS